MERGKSCHPFIIKDGGYEMKEITNLKIHMDFVDCLAIRAAIN